MSTRFINKLSQKLFQNTETPRERIVAVIAYERGHHQGHWHLQGVIALPPDLADAALQAAVESAWQGQPFAYSKDIYIKRFEKSLGANFNYISKEGMDHIIYEPWRALAS